MKNSNGRIKRPWLILFITLTSILPVFSQETSFSGTGWQSANSTLAAALTSSGRGLNSSIIDAMKKVPRHLFADEAYYYIAYEDISLPGLSGGILPSPSDSVTALEMLAPASTDTVLVAGNNAGYSAAILSQLTKTVYLIEETGSASSYAEIFKNSGFENIIVAEEPDINAFSDIFAFEKIFIHGAASEISEKITERLSIQGNITFILSQHDSFQQIVTLRRSLLGDSISCGGNCYFPEINRLKISN